MKIKTFVPVVVLCSIALIAQPVLAQKDYVPPAGNWKRRTPERAGLDPAKLKGAVDFAIASESKTPKSLEQAHLQSFGREPYGEPLGQFKDRGGATGLIIRNGYIVAEWG